MKYDYNKFLQILNETKNLNNSLNQVLKYDFIYNSNKIDGSNFNIEELQLLVEKRIVSGTHNLDDVYITLNSFKVMDLVLEVVNRPLTIETLTEWFKALIRRTRIGDSGIELYNKEAEEELKELINKYNSIENPTIDDICRFHLEFERIHYFYVCNDRIGRFIFLRQLIENKLSLKYMSGDTANDYKKSLADSSKDKVEPLVNYIDKQKDFIEENINMF